MPHPRTQPLTRRLLQRSRRKRPKQRKPRPLRFSPYAWAKLIYLRDRGSTEVGGFGITEPDDPKFVQDVETFARVFGNCDWSVMFILARNGATYAELKHSDRSKAEKLSVGIDFKPQFAASNHSAWEEEYRQSVHEALLSPLWGLSEWFEDEIACSEQWPVFPI